MTEVVYSKVRCPYLDQLYRKDPKIVDDILDKYRQWCRDENADNWNGIGEEWTCAQDLKYNHVDLCRAVWCETYAAATVEIAKHPKTKFYDLITKGIVPFYNNAAMRMYNYGNRKEEYSPDIISVATAAASAWSVYTNTSIPI